MTAVEMEIIQYLRQSPGAFFARKEIARRARPRDEYEAEPNWVAGPLGSLVAQGIVEQNDSGHYRLSENFKG